MSPLPDRPSEPFAARLHWIPRTIRPIQNALIRLLRYYFERAPGWVLLTTTGRKSGLPREVLLPCERSADGIIVISTYGDKADWMRNLRRDPRVRVTCGGWVVPGRAEVIEDVAAKQALLRRYPFFPAMPTAPFHILFRLLLRPLLVMFLQQWVVPRPVVVIRQEP